MSVQHFNIAEIFTDFFINFDALPGFSLKSLRFARIQGNISTILYFHSVAGKSEMILTFVFRGDLLLVNRPFLIC